MEHGNADNKHKDTWLRNRYTGTRKQIMNSFSRNDYSIIATAAATATVTATATATANANGLSVPVTGQY